MRVLLLLANDGDGGMQTAVATLYSLLNEAGVETAVAVGGPISSSILPGTTHELPPFRGRSGGYRFITALRQLAEAFDPSVVSGYGLRLAPAVRIAARGRVAAVTAAGMPAEDVRRAARVLRALRTPVNAVGNGPAMQLHRQGVKVTVLPEPVLPPPNPTDRRSLCMDLDLDPERPLAASVLRLSPQKDPLTLIRAIARSSRWNLLLCGDGPMRSVVKHQILEQRVGDRIRLLGWRNDVREIVGCSDAALLSSRFEGKPRALIEAMVAGVPVVSTACPGVVEWIEDGRNGLLAPVGDHAALAAQLDRLLDEPSLRSGMIAEGRRTAQPHLGTDAAMLWIEYFSSLSTKALG